MRFNGYEFNVKPSSIKIRHCFNVIPYYSPFCFGVQNLGNMPVEISGQGYFVGKDCIAQYKQLLKNIACDGLLIIDGYRPIKANLKELSIKSENSAEIISYDFLFIGV